LKKIEMFNEGGEIALFDRTGLRPVFFGQTLIGRRQPNLVYMTVHQDMAARENIWEQFGNSEDWKKLRSMPAFAFGQFQTRRDIAAAIRVIIRRKTLILSFI